MNYSFKVGDVVSVTAKGHQEYDRLPTGLTGYIARICDGINDNIVSVNFDMSNWHRGHDSNGYFPGANTYWNFCVEDNSLELVQSQQSANIKELF